MSIYPQPPLIEEVEPTSPNTSGFAQDGGHSVATYTLDNPSVNPTTNIPFDTSNQAPTFLQNAVIQTLGYTFVNPQTGMLAGALNRVPPLAHPTYSFQFADSIMNIRGIGKWNVAQTGDPNNASIYEVPPLPFWAVYQRYWVTCKYTQRPYYVIGNTNAVMVPNNWNGTAPSTPLIPGIGTGVQPVVAANAMGANGGAWYDDTGTLRQYNYAPEWVRYTDFSLEPRAEAITAQQGTMAFCDPTGPRSLGGYQGVPYQAMPKMNLPNLLLTFRWWFVPLRYITSQNSYITGGTSTRGSWFGRVNANQITLGGVSYPAGSLLYTGYKPTIFTPPIQQLGGVGGYPGVYATDKLCHIEFYFLYTLRVPPGPLPGYVNTVIGPGNTILIPNDVYITIGPTSPFPQVGDVVGLVTPLSFIPWYTTVTEIYPSGNAIVIAQKNPAMTVPTFGTITIYNAVPYKYTIGGHNLLPNYQDRKWYYTTSTIQTEITLSGSQGTASLRNTGAPSWLGAPFELLFYDPDAPPVPGDNSTSNWNSYNWGT